MSLDAASKPRDSRIFTRQEHDHYVEPEWCSERLFDVEAFSGPIWDPCCGWGRIVDSAAAHGHLAHGSDIVDRAGRFGVKDFLTEPGPSWDIVCNPPFDLSRRFAEQALKLTKGKVAMIWLWRRLPAARWLAETPLARVWLLTPRPSMPSGKFIAKGGKVGGGTQDFCWLVWDRSHSGPPEMLWLKR